MRSAPDKRTEPKVSKLCVKIISFYFIYYTK